MKEKYTALDVEVLRFEPVDIITESPAQGGTDNGNGVVGAVSSFF